MMSFISKKETNKKNMCNEILMARSVIHTKYAQYKYYVCTLYKRNLFFLFIQQYYAVWI